MKIRGIVFVGTRTDRHEAMTVFAREVLGLREAPVAGMAATRFVLPDRSAFAVSPTDEPDGERTIGFLVDDLVAAAAELRAAGVEVDDEVAANSAYQYVHFRAPDGHLYELVEVVGEPR